MLKVLMEFRKGVLFVRLYGTLNSSTIDIFKKDVKEVIIASGIMYVVLNTYNLEEITKEEPEYAEARRLMEILRYFQTIPENMVPSNSLLKEFLGGGDFKG